MKRQKTFITLILIFSLALPCFAVEITDEWKADKLDARRAVPNNFMPPERLEPENIYYQAR